MPDLPKTFSQARRSPVKRQGGSTHLRDHSRAYKALRASVLDQEALCRYCRHDGRIVPATVVDHIVALSLAGTNDRDNLAPACRACNDAKQAREVRFAKRGYDPRDIMLDPDLAEWIRRGRMIPAS